MTGHIKSKTRRGQNKEQLLESGLDILWRHGFNATGVQEIANASGVPKGSFYNYFDSKEAFAIAALERYAEVTCANLEAVLIKGKGSPLTRLRGLFQGWTKTFFQENNGCGCFAGNMSQEFANHSPVIRKALDRAFARMQAYYTACLEEAQAAGEIGESDDPKLLAAFIYNAWQGALVRAKTQGDTTALKQFQKVVFGRLLV